MSIKVPVSAWSDNYKLLLGRIRRRGYRGSERRSSCVILIFSRQRQKRTYGDPGVSILARMARAVSSEARNHDVEDGVMWSALIPVELYSDRKSISRMLVCEEVPTS
jgi:hypothetical protein